MGAEIQATGNLASQYNRAVVSFNNWHITIEFGYGRGRSAASFTRIRVPFVSKDELGFNITHKNILSNVGKHILTGNLEFDKVFAVSGNDESKIMTILSDSKVLESLQSNNEVLKLASVKLVCGYAPEFSQGMTATNTPPKGIHTLMFYKIYPLFWNEDLELFKQVSEIFREILVKLVDIGCASEEDPKFGFSDLYSK